MREYWLVSAVYLTCSVEAIGLTVPCHEPFDSQTLRAFDFFVTQVPRKWKTFWQTSRTRTQTSKTTVLTSCLYSSALQLIECNIECTFIALYIGLSFSYSHSHSYRNRWLLPFKVLVIPTVSSWGLASCPRALQHVYCWNRDVNHQFEPSLSVRTIIISSQVALQTESQRPHAIMFLLKSLCSFIFCISETPIWIPRTPPLLRHWMSHEPEFIIHLRVTLGGWTQMQTTVS